MQSSQLPSEQSLMSKCQQDQPIPEDWVHYCIHIRVPLGEGETLNPTFQYMEWFVNCGHVLERYWRADYWSGRTCPWGISPILWPVIMQGRIPLGKYQRCRIQIDRPHQLDWYGSSGRGNCKYCTARLPSHSRSCCGKENQGKGVRTSLQPNKGNEDPHHCIWHQRVDAGHGKGCFQKGGVKGQCS